jgi:hypothetical protein
MPRFDMRVSEEELAVWRGAAGEGSLSSWVRRVCDRAAGGGVGVAASSDSDGRLRRPGEWRAEGEPSVVLVAAGAAVEAGWWRCPQHDPRAFGVWRIGVEVCPVCDGPLWPVDPSVWVVENPPGSDSGRIVPEEAPESAAESAAGL